MDLPILYFPIRIALIDDDDLILDTLKLAISSKYNLITFNSANQIFQYLKNNTFDINKFLKGLYQKEINDFFELQIDFNLENILTFAKNKEKYENIGIIASDYCMPDINGLELFSRLQKQYKKILLTGHSDLQVFISAFNEKIIDKFIPKSDNYLISKLETSFDILTLEFFNEITDNIKSNIEIVNKNKLPLSDPIFINFLCELIKEKKINEYYLIDSIGSLLLINEKKEQFYLAIHTEDSLNNFVYLYDDNDFNIYTNSIRERSKIPFFAEKEPIKIDLNNWNNYLYQPEILCGNNLYYYTFMERRTHYV